MRKKTRLSRRGNPHLRKAVYLPTVTALSRTPLVKAFYERLVAAAGKPKMAALAAAMRKLLMLAVGVLRSGKPSDPKWTDTVSKTEETTAAVAT